MTGNTAEKLTGTDGGQQAAEPRPWQVRTSRRGPPSGGGIPPWAQWFSSFRFRLASIFASALGALIAGLVGGAFTGWIVTRSVVVAMIAAAGTIMVFGEAMRSTVVLGLDRTRGIIEPKKVTTMTRLDSDGRPEEIEIRHPLSETLRRLLDLLISALAVVLLAPVMLVAAAAIRLNSPGPVIFTQFRVGHRGKMFTIRKFRTMRTDAEEVLRKDLELYRRYQRSGYKLPEHEDPRISRVGAFLRRTGIDELPQLINVLEGTMSLVGPRPMIPDLLEDRGETDLTKERLLVLPGLVPPEPHSTGQESKFVLDRTIRTYLRTLVAIVPKAFNSRA